MPILKTYLGLKSNFWRESCMCNFRVLIAVDSWAPQVQQSLKSHPM